MTKNAVDIDVEIDLLTAEERQEHARAVQLELFHVTKQIESIAGYLLRRRLDLRHHLRVIKNNGLKSCRRCLKEKDVSRFYREGRYADGHHPYCKDCVNTANINRYHKRKAEAA